MTLYKILQKFYMAKNQHGPLFTYYSEPALDGSYECWINLDNVCFKQHKDVLEIIEKMKKKVKNSEFIIREIEV